MGGQSVPNFDYGLAVGVRKSFVKAYKHNLNKLISYKHIPDDDVLDIGYVFDDIKPDFGNTNDFDDRLLEYCIRNNADITKTDIEFIRKQAVIETREETYQAMEALIHNLNTMHCLPASAKIWVVDTTTNEVKTITMVELNDTFETGKYKVLSLNMDTNKNEYKRVLMSQRKDSNREMVTLVGATGQRVTVTTNHKVLSITEDGKLYKDYPDKIKYMVSPEYLTNDYDIINPLIEYLETSDMNMANSAKIVNTDSGETVYKVEIVDRIFSNSGDEFVYDISVEDNENFVTADMIAVSNSRAGAQVPFTSINYGTDTSPEGRLIMEAILKATDRGLGNGETPIFPIQIFKVKEGVSCYPGDPNYDLFQLACKVSAKRLFPNFSFIDAPFNIPYYKPGHPETECAYMGCRTRVMANVYDPTREIAYSRGNLSFTSINLPRLAIEANGDLDKFFNSLTEKVLLVEDQLLARLKIQSLRKMRNYPFLMGEGVWLDSKTLGPDDSIAEVLKHGTLTVGFIGLAETLKCLIGKHHGESNEAQELGLKIISHMRKLTDEAAQKYKLNFSLIATPAEGLSGRFIRMDKARYGIIEGVTDRDYYTNSFHIPVYYNISAFDKIRLEAPYHNLTNGGHISYIELDGDPTKNLEAFEAIIHYMKDCGIGYGSINHPVDHDPVCGYTGIIGDVCPRCGRHDGEGVPLSKLQQLGLYKDYNASTIGYHGDVYEEADRNLNPNT